MKSTTQHIRTLSNGIKHRIVTMLYTHEMDYETYMIFIELLDEFASLVKAQHSSETHERIFNFLMFAGFTSDKNNPAGYVCARTAEDPLAYVRSLVSKAQSVSDFISDEVQMLY